MESHWRYPVWFLVDRIIRELISKGASLKKPFQVAIQNRPGEISWKSSFPPRKNPDSIIQNPTAYEPCIPIELQTALLLLSIPLLSGCGPLFSRSLSGIPNVLNSDVMIYGRWQRTGHHCEVREINRLGPTAHWNRRIVNVYSFQETNGVIQVITRCYEHS